MKQIFAKIFDCSDKQILVTKEFNQNDMDAQFEVKFTTQISDCCLSCTAGFETQIEQDDFFKSVDSEMALTMIEPLCF